MKRVVLEKPYRLSYEDCGEQVPGPGDVLVEIRACGICGSDVHAYLGKHPFVKYPVTPGHEFSGVVVAAGDDVEPGLLGSRVCVEPSLACGDCPQCRSGRYNICDNLRVLGFQADGAMCERITVPRNRIHLLPQGVDFPGGALAEPAAVGIHALARSGAGSGSGILVIGGGVIGLMITRAAKALGCRVTVMENTRERVKRALGFGADEALLFGEEPPGKTGEIQADAGFQAVFECVGKPETIQLALRLAPRGSTVVVVGVFSQTVPVQISLVQDGELNVCGTLMYTGEDFKRALDLIAGGVIEPDDFITQTVGLDKVEYGYNMLIDPETPTVKVLVEFGGGNKSDS